jgi:hypothetical protein
LLRPLNQLPPGTRFRQPDLDITGKLLMVNECRALVRIDQPQQVVAFTSPDGSIRTFRASRNHDTSCLYNLRMSQKEPSHLIEVSPGEPPSESGSQVNRQPFQ